MGELMGLVVLTYDAPGATLEMTAAAEFGGFMSSGAMTLFTFPSWSVSDLAVWSCFQTPSATNCGHERQQALFHALLLRKSMRITHLVKNLLVRPRQGDGLLKHSIFLVQLHALAPVVEGAGNKDFFGGVFPTIRLDQASCNA
jgi:hypothetical protein